MVIDVYQPAFNELHIMMILEFLERRRYTGMDSVQDSIALAAIQQTILHPGNQDCIAVAVGRLQVNRLRGL
jgi:hypothetical protein